MASSARIDELRKKFEENPRRYFAPLANEYRKAGDIEQAISICKEYLPQQPGHMSGHIVYGQALYEARQYEEARTVFETALALDPENLIALRHLGDIALIVGDIDGARGWYGRVLEADPRNEEIQAQLKSLESVGPAAAPTPMSTPAIESAVPPTPTASPEPARPMPEGASAPALELAPLEMTEPAHSPSSSAPTVVVPAMPMPTIERTVEIPATPPSAPVQSLSTAPTAEITLDQVPVPAVPDLEKAAEAPGADLPVEKAAGFEPTANAAAETEPVGQTAGVEPTSAPASDAPPIESFTLAGLETTSMSPPSPAEVSPPPAEVAAPETPTPAALPDFEVTPAPASETAPPAAETAPPAAETAPPAAETAPPSAPEAPAPTAEAPPTADASAPSSELTFLDVGDPSPARPEAAVSEPLREPAHEPAHEPAIAESKPFVTETMAELYEQQGHRDEALRVYRALLEQRPNDAHIRSRIEQLEGKRGPTIRELLARVAARRPAQQSVIETQPASAPTEPATTPPEPVARPTEPEAQHAPAEPEAQPEPARARSDLLGQLFSHASVSGADENAAITLAAAFSNDGRANGGGSASQQLFGTPAHPASQDLSLDSVFGTQSATPPPASSFSFDQFFSERATAEQPAAGGRSTGEGQETKDDVARFTQWLEGLKQR